MTRIQGNWTGLVILLLAVGGMGSEAFTQPIDPGPGLAVGTEAPAFVLRNQADEDVTLAQLLSEHSVALVFFRSADW